MDCYLLVLEGGGDIFTAIVDQETWDWINSEVPATVGDGEVSWSEREIMPQRVREAIDKSGDEDPEITIGSYQNDRAIHVSMVDGAALYSGDTKREAKEWARKQGYTIKDTFNGCFY